MRRILVWVVLGAFGLLLAAAPRQVLAQQAQEAPMLPSIGERGFLAAYLIDLTPQSITALGLPLSRAVLVVYVFLGNSAERAGLRAGDVISEFEGAIVPRADDLDAAMQRRGAGATVEIGLWRGGQLSTVRVTLDRYADISEKVDVAEVEALVRIFNHETFPREWAALQWSLGRRYATRSLGDPADRTLGDPADNMEKAIAAHERALTVYTHEALPLEWAKVHSNLGTFYLYRIRGDRADNLEKAIAAHELALTVYTREATPLTWAIIQNHLGKAYQYRIRGDRAENVEKAIATRELALTAFTRETSPYEWAGFQNDLGTAYTSRIRGDLADNLEKAIAAYEQALTVPTREALPQLWAETQLNLGDAYPDRIRGDKAGNLEKAIGAFEAARTIFTRGALPRHHLRTSRRLGAAWLQARVWHKAGEAYASAREAFLQLFGQGLNDAEARHLIEEAGPLFAEAAFAAAERGDLKAALELADEGRARQLRVALRRQGVDLPPQERPRYDALVAELRGWERIAETAKGTDAVAALEKVATLRQQLGELIGPHLPKQVGLTREGIPEGGAVVVPVVTKLGGKLLIATAGRGGPEIGVVDLPEVTSARLDRSIRGDGGWLGAYRAQHREKQWLAAIEGLGRELWDLLGESIDRGLKARGVKPGARVAVLPTAALGLLPLGLAQDPTSKQRLAETWEIVQAPSFEALATAAAQVAQPTAPSLAAAINPTGDLPFTEIEGALVAARFAGRLQLKLDTSVATANLVLAALEGKSYWHFASHGAFDWNDARQSGLVMREGERLTVGRLIEAQGSLGRPRLVVLSACETGLYDIDRNPDEFVGLPATFMQAGAAGVVSSLWLVDDLATALLMAKFYDLHLGAPGGGLAPPTALRQAQAWMRESTRGELMAYARTAVKQARIDRVKLAELSSVLSTGTRSPLSRFSGLWEALTAGAEPAPQAKQKQKKGKLAPRAKRPFEHPYFWAGFVYTGL